MNPTTFFSQFRFNPALRGAMGVETEYFLTDEDGIPVPRSSEFLCRIEDPAWTYELSACQVEHRTVPCMRITDVLSQLRTARLHARCIADLMGVAFRVIEVGDSRMPLTVYPDDPRYANIAQMITPEMLHAACRVAATHIHIGVQDIKEAIRVSNALSHHIEQFMQLGDHSRGERLRLYHAMAKTDRPPHYESPDHFYAVGQEQGFLEDPRRCYHLIRISVHGTVEVRTFGVTEDLSEIGRWIDVIRNTLR